MGKTRRLDVLVSWRCESARYTKVIQWGDAPLTSALQQISVYCNALHDVGEGSLSLTFRKLTKNLMRSVYSNLNGGNLQLVKQEG